MLPSRTQRANHSPATGEREPPEHTPTRECAHPDDAESRPDVAETRKRENPTRVSQARREHPADNTRDSSGQQRNRTSPTQRERTD